jgi:hypothetical protein
MAVDIRFHTITLPGGRKVGIGDAVRYTTANKPAAGLVRDIYFDDTTGTYHMDVLQAVVDDSSQHEQVSNRVVQQQTCRVFTPPMLFDAAGGIVRVHPRGGHCEGR